MSMTIQKMYNPLTSLLDKAIRPLLGRVIGFEGMPTYPSYTWNGRSVHIMPHDFARRYVRSIPFYNGSLASFDLSIFVPRKKRLTNDVRFTWRSHFKGQGIEHKGEGQEPDKTGEGVISIAEIRKCWGLLRISEQGLVYRRDLYGMVFNLRNAIDCGLLLGERGDYEITLHISDGVNGDIDMIGTQFELRNIDDYHHQYVGYLLAAVFGAVAGLIASVIWLAFKGG